MLIYFRFGLTAYLYIYVAFIQMLKGLNASACYKDLNSKNNYNVNYKDLNSKNNYNVEYEKTWA